MPLTGQWKNPAYWRCHGKRKFSAISSAEKVAAQDSAHTGELIIAYKCYDCGLFHVGHADLSQRIAHERSLCQGHSLPTICPHCGKSISEERRVAARESGNQNVYCSTKCSEKGRKKARHIRKAKQEAEFNEWLNRYDSRSKPDVDKSEK